MEVVASRTMIKDSNSIEAQCARCGNSFERIKEFGALAKYQTLCPACADADHKAETATLVDEGIQLRARKGDEIFKEICPPLYQDTDPRRIKSQNLQKVLGWKYGPKGIVVLGESGKGKTRAMYLLIRRLLNEGKTVRVFDSVDFEMECSDRFYHGTGKAWVKALTDYDVILFDDLGKFRLTDRVESVLFGLWEKRIAFLKPILATTNDTGETLEDRMSENRGAPFVRRIKEFCECVVF